jgi:tripartite ATP-independent transporter DctP family solute receptor
MQRRRTLWLAVLLMVFISVGTVCAEPIVLKLGHTMPPTHPANEAALEIAEEVAARTNGAIEIQVYPAAQLGGAKDLIEATIRGTQHMAFDGPGVISQFFPKISVLDMPFLFDSYDQFLRVYNSSYGEELRQELLEKRNLRVLDVCYYGSRQLTTSKKPVRTIDDMKGLKLRVPEVQESLESFRAIGASPTPVAFGEVYFALQTGVVDGQENPLTTIYTYKFYEVQKYLTLSNHQIATLFLMINDDVWQSLTPEQQQIMLEAAAKALERYNAKIFEDEERLVNVLKEEGLEVIELDPEVRNRFKEAVRSIYSKFDRKWGADTVQKIEGVLAQ